MKRGGGLTNSQNWNCDILLFRLKPTFSGLVRSRTPPLARSSCLAFLKSSPVGGCCMAALLLPPYCATDNLRFPWHSDDFSSGSPRYFNSLILRSSVRYSDTIPCAYLRYDSVVTKQEKVCYETLRVLTMHVVNILRPWKEVPCMMGKPSLINSPLLSTAVFWPMLTRPHVCHQHSFTLLSFPKAQESVTAYVKVVYLWDFFPQASYSTSIFWLTVSCCDGLVYQYFRGIRPFHLLGNVTDRKSTPHF
jgi:hypothetical protein